VIVLILACEEPVQQVNLLGMVQDAPFNGGTPVEGAALEARNRDGEVTGESESDGDGAFSVEVDRGVPFFLTLSHPDLVSTGFSGVAGMSDFDAGTGYPWMATPGWVEALRADHVNCAEAALEGGIVVGEVRASIAEVYDMNQWPTLGETTVVVVDHTGAQHGACYFDDEGVSVAGGEYTGVGGLYAVFGVEPGAINVAVTVERSSGEAGTDVFEFILPEAGLVPIFPTAVWL
jgi:hypothetical protein